MENERIVVDASRIDVTLAGPSMHATGSVKSVVRPADPTGRGRGGKDDVRVPSMFKDDRPVNATADQLDYDGTAKRATYVGGAQLWQGDTTIKGSTITLDEDHGDLKATDPTTRTVLVQRRGEDGKGEPKERVTSIAAAKELVYDEATRRVTYVGAVRLSGPQGDMTSPKIELYLKASGDELERVEAYEIGRASCRERV